MSDSCSKAAHPIVANKPKAVDHAVAAAEPNAGMQQHSLGQLPRQRGERVPGEVRLRILIVYAVLCDPYGQRGRCGLGVQLQQLRKQSLTEAPRACRPVPASARLGSADRKRYGVES